MQRLQTYCSEDLGGFYLDVLKDRLYTAARDEPRAALGADGAGADPRRAAQADGADPVVHRRGSVADRASRRADDLRAHVGRMLPARRRTPTALVGEVGADPRGARAWCRRSSRRCARPARSARRCRPKSTIAAPADDYAALASLGDDLRFVLITSAATRDARATRWRSRSRRARIRSASAAGTSAPTSAPMPRIRRCAGAAWPTCSAPASRARSRDGTSAMTGTSIRRSRARWQLRWLWLSAAVIVARPGRPRRAIARGVPRRARSCRSRRSSAWCSPSTRARRSASSPAPTAGSAGSSRRSPSPRASLIVWLLQRGGSRLLLRRARADPRRRARQPVRPPGARPRRRFPAVPLRAAGTGRRSTSPTARSPSARRC